ncbi:Hypothetical predicted protein [Octopus vulgaris]|uniref:Uncharacterized protein n=1 Tax=Octopus vulgaris TaxID=6645 RepID=A0AA36AX17_OCTVU|nr:Hypothetical predicted protein [Octopus vulgaris]
MREDPEYRAKERERNAAAQRRNRLSEEYRARERAKNALSRAQARMDDEYRRKEREENAISMAILRQNDEYRRKERVRNARAMAQARANRKFEQAEARMALKRNNVNSNSQSETSSRRVGEGCGDILAFSKSISNNSEVDAEVLAEEMVCWICG